MDISWIQTISSAVFIVATIGGGLAWIYGRLDKKFANIDQRFEKIDQRFEKIDQRFEKIDQRFEQFRKDMDQRFDQLEKKFEVRFGKIEEELKGLSNRITLLGEKINSLDVRISRIEGVLSVRENWWEHHKEANEG